MRKKAPAPYDPEHVKDVRSERREAIAHLARRRQAWAYRVDASAFDKYLAAARS